MSYEWPLKPSPFSSHPRHEEHSLYPPSICEHSGFLSSFQSHSVSSAYNMPSSLWSTSLFCKSHPQTAPESLRIPFSHGNDLIFWTIFSLRYFFKWQHTWQRHFSGRKSLLCASQFQSLGFIMMGGHGTKEKFPSPWPGAERTPMECDFV